MNDSDRPTVSAADLEPGSSHAPLGAEEAAGLDTRVHIRVISYRRRNHDPDGVSVKAVLDGLIRRGLLPNDSAKYVREVTFQSVVGPGEERTEIVISGVSE